jgi:hypothetical protein
MLFILGGLLISVGIGRYLRSIRVWQRLGKVRDSMYKVMEWKVRVFIKWQIILEWVGTIWIRVLRNEIIGGHNSGVSKGTLYVGVTSVLKGLLGLRSRLFTAPIANQGRDLCTSKEVAEKRLAKGICWIREADRFKRNSLESLMEGNSLVESDSGRLKQSSRGEGASRRNIIGDRIKNVRMNKEKEWSDFDWKPLIPEEGGLRSRTSRSEKVSNNFELRSSDSNGKENRRDDFILVIGRVGYGMMVYSGNEESPAGNNGSKEVFVESQPEGTEKGFREEPGEIPTKLQQGQRMEPQEELEAGSCVRRTWELILVEWIGVIGDRLKWLIVPEWESRTPGWTKVTERRSSETWNGDLFLKVMAGSKRWSGRKGVLGLYSWDTGGLNSGGVNTGVSRSWFGYCKLVLEFGILNSVGI